MKRYVIGCVVLAILLCGGAGQAKAGFVVYTDQAAFDANTTGLTTINFEGIAPDNDFTSVPVPPGLTVSGVQFTIDQTNDDGNLFVIGKGFYYPDNSVLSSQESDTGANNLVITIPGSGVTAVGLDLSSFLARRRRFFFPRAIRSTCRRHPYPTWGLLDSLPPLPSPL